MSAIAEAEQLALSLSKADRGKLASKLIQSLGKPFEDEDDWVEEAIQRSREMDEKPETVMTHEEYLSSFEKYHRNEGASPLSGSRRGCRDS
jgi:hypothetical protein